MDPIGSGLSISASGLRVAQRQLDRSAHNVANVNTDGFEARREVQTDVAEGGVRPAGSVPTGDTAPVAFRDGQLVNLSNTSIAAETVNRISGVQAYRANLATLRAQDEALESLLKS